jgi:signal peptidase I
VVFRFPGDESKLYVKRILGLPGEKLEIIDGYIYINGSTEALRDEFIKGARFGNFGPYQIPEGMYFMMGDNRIYSQDSRDWNNPYVEKGKILGKVVFKYFPRFKNLYGL